MFKNSEDEIKFDRILCAYKSEFGESNLELRFPSHSKEGMNSSKYGLPMDLTFWRRNKYRIGVKDLSAVFIFTPEEQ